MRIVFLGTGEISIPCLQMLIDSNWIDLVGVVTQPDKRVGRKQILTSPEVKILAQSAGVQVFQPENVSSLDSVEKIKGWDPEIIVVMAYGQILKQNFLDLASKACINVHASLLPKYRGASCIQAAIANGDEETGVSIMHVVKKLDAGDVIIRDRIVIGSADTGGNVHDALARRSPAVLEKALCDLADGSANREVQIEEESTYAPKLLRNDGLIDWSQSAEKLELRIRAYDPWPGTFTTFIDSKGKERRLKIFPPVQLVVRSGEAAQILEDEGEGLVVACGQNSLRVTSVQPEGKQRMSVDDFLKGSGVISLC